MNKELLVGMANLLNIAPESVTKEDIADEDVQTILADAKKLRIMNDEQFNTVAQNIREDYKVEAHKGAKGSILESIENEIKAKYGKEEFVRGTDYDNTMSLLEKIVSEKSTKTDDTEDKKTISELQNALRAKNEEVVKTVQDVETKYNGQIHGLLLDGALGGIKHRLPVEKEQVDGTVNILKTMFNNEFKISMLDGKQIVKNKETGDTIKDENFAPKSISQVVADFVPNYYKLKDNVPPKGRGVISPPTNQPTGGAVNWRNHKQFDSFLLTDAGKALTSGSKEMKDAYSQWKAATGG